MARTRFGFFPAPGTNYSRGQEPEIARRLNKLGRALKLHLIGLSGYRTPQHSVDVGGFADDPHTRGQASDTPGIENVPEATLRRFGLTRPFPGAQEADHIQLFGGGRGTTRPPRRGSHFTLADYWKQGGGAPNLAPIMAAIGMAESGGRIDAIGGPNDDGTYDYGWLQINSSHGYDKARLLSDPVYTARAGVAIERSQGLGAWTTYRTGAFRRYLGTGKDYVPKPGIVRPGGEQPTDDGVSAEFASYTEDAGWHWSPLSPIPFPTPFKVPGFPDLGNPLGLFKDSANAVKDAADFFKWIAWIFHPKNVLRAVEFLSGLTIMGFGLHTMIAVYRNDSQAGAIPRARQATGRAAREAASLTPPGRALRARRAAGFGKRQARREIREKEAQRASRKGRSKETKRQARKTQKRDVRRARFSREEVPF